MDKDEDLFDVHKSLAPPEDELKKENDKKKMKVEVYIASGFYEQLLDYSKIKQSKIKNHLIIPQNLKSDIIKHFVELSIDNVKTGYQMNQKNLTSKDIDKLVQEFKDKKLLETQDNSKIELKSKQITPIEIPQKKLYSRIFQPINYQRKNGYINISIDNFLVSDQTNNNTQQIRLNRILEMFNFN